MSRRASQLRFAAMGLAVALLVLLAAETTLRAYLALRVGPDLLLYGTRWNEHRIKGLRRQEAYRRSGDFRGRATLRNNTAARHDAAGDGYTKYAPHQLRFTYDPETGEAIRVGINSAGFRGPEFAREKPPGFVRVLALGASSTFGFLTRDTGTWPHQLGGLLEEACPRRRHEVVNLGIPHLRADEVGALFRAEGAPLAADVAVYYGGYNDSGFSKRRLLPYVSGVTPTYRFLRDRVALVAFVSELLNPVFRRYTPADLARNLDGRAAAFVESLEALRAAVEASGARFVLASQQARSLSIPREALRGVSYADEVARVRAASAERGWLRREELIFLTHAELRAAQRAWARAAGVPLADAAAALDDRRDRLVSWVHLDAAGNQVLAGAVAEAVLDATCAPPATPTGG